MMQSSYTICQDGSKFEAAKWNEAVALLNGTAEFIIELSGCYLAALSFLEDHGIDARLNCEIVNNSGMDILTGINNLKVEVESLRDEANYKLNHREG